MLIAKQEQSHLLSANLFDKIFFVKVYLSAPYVALELFPDIRDDYHFERSLSYIRRSINSLQSVNGITQKLEVICTLLRNITDLDRVMIYKFDEAANGEVIAEAKADQFESYLHLHYPASDIPPQARELFLKNIVRVIQDVNYEPCGISGSNFQPIDMTYGMLRSVSPFHVKYLQNMGVQATVVCSLIKDHKLWGLISCHHYSPKSIGYQLHEIFCWMSMIVSKEIKLSEFKAKEAQSDQLKHINQKLLNDLRRGDYKLSGLFNADSGKDLLSIVNADGVACIFENTVLRYGLTPNTDEILRIYNKLKSLNYTNEPSEVATNSLPELLGEPSSSHPFSSGLIALPVFKNKNQVLMFFRQEFVKTVTWGGNPDMAVLIDNGQLTPRHSFEAWKKTITGTSKAWSPAEIESAEQFVAAIDIEIRNQAEAELQLLRSSVANLNDAILITEAEPLDKPGPKILFVNGAFEKHSGYKSTELIGKTPRIFQGPNTSRHTLDVLRQNLRAWKKFRVELINYRKDGSEFWSEIDFTPIADASGYYTHWISVQRDITERKLTEDTLRFIAQKSWLSNGTEFLNNLAEHIAYSLNVDYVLIGKLIADNNSIQTKSFFGFGKLLDTISYDLRGSPCESVLNGSLCSFPNDVIKFFPDCNLLVELGIQSYAGITLRNNDGKPLGIIALMDKKPMREASLYDSVLKLIANRVESELIRQDSQAYIWHQANYDSLTDLPNRRMFQDCLVQEFNKVQRSSLKLALMFLDLDNFKEINDSLGHDIGDMLLKETSTRIQQCVRQTDTLARLGGDEFTVILSELNDIECVERIASKIIDAIALPFYLGNEVVFISISIGITIFPDDSNNLDELTKNADQAMYAAKAAGRNCFYFFTQTMQKETFKRMRITKELRPALDLEQFNLVYQPIVNLHTNQIYKAEALIRWRHPNLGNVLPNEFIKIAEETGLISSIGDWVFREAAKKTQLLRLHCDPKFQVSINKSPVQFRNQVSKYDAWFDYIQTLGLTGNAIIVEITESAFLESNANVHRILDEFRAHGLEIAIDDFGTGYSSMSYLKKFDIDYLKIDRSFVSSLIAGSDDMALCEAMIVMAHTLGMKVIAEGVETIEQRNLLQIAGADYAQGYLFSQPLEFDEFELFLKNSR